MPNNIKEYDGYLLDQLTLLERIENTLKKKSVELKLQPTDFFHLEQKLENERYAKSEVDVESSWID